MQELYAKNAERGIILISYLVGGGGMAAWAEKFGITHPVMEGTDLWLDTIQNEQLSKRMGTWLLLKPGMVVHKEGWGEISEADIDAIVP